MDVTTDSAEALDTPALVRIATAAGYILSTRMLETFRSDSLIPRPTRVGYRGRAPRWLYPRGSGRQLLALLRHRERTKDPNVLRVLLWLEGYPIPIESVRRSINDGIQVVMSGIEREIAARADRPDVDSRDEAIRQLASGVAAKRGRKALPRRSRIKANDRARSAELLIRTFVLGEDVEVTSEDADTVERTMGLTPNGRRHRIDGAGPWLTGPATALFDAADVIALPRAIQSIIDATDAELALARDLVQVLWQGLPVVARMMAVMFDDDNFAGMAGLARLDEDPDIVIILVPAVVGMLRIGWSDNIEATAASLRAMPDFAADMQQVLDLPSALVQERLSSQPAKDQLRMQRMIAAALDGTLPTKAPINR